MAVSNKLSKEIFKFSRLSRHALNLQRNQSTTAPLTMFSEEEKMFQESTRKFALDRVAPLVKEMDAAQIGSFNQRWTFRTRVHGN